MLGRVTGVLLALLLHLSVLCFGGLILPRGHGKVGHQTVELVTEDLEKAADKPVEQPEPEPAPPEELEAQAEQPPEDADITSVAAASDNTPALDAASLSAIEAALNPGAGAGEFAGAVSLASGGRIGGTGKTGAEGGSSDVEQAFGMDEIDQKPRVTVQTPPSYPAELKGKKMAGVVQVAFVVTTSGHVTRVRVERSSHPAFERPALAAVRQWRFEPAVKAGERVQCRMRVPIRFQSG